MCVLTRLKVSSWSAECVWYGWAYAFERGFGGGVGLLAGSGGLLRACILQIVLARLLSWWNKIDQEKRFASEEVRSIGG